MSANLRNRLVRQRANRASGAASSSLTDQISQAIRAAIVDGRLEPGARLPSWRDLAAQLGVARGTVRVAYERLADELLVTASGPSGTHVSAPGARPARAPAVQLDDPAHRMPAVPLPFQMGMPAHDGFPAKLWTRIVARAARASIAAPVATSHPCGALELRTQIAGYLAISRGLRCAPSQIIITRGYRDGLNLAIRTLRVEGGAAWMEEPGFMLTRAGLALAGIQPVPIVVDEHGLDVAHGIATAPDAALAVVTAGQQAPLGVTLAGPRREALVRWAARTGAWIIEDDYLSELQLTGRPAPALMAMDDADRVIYAGTFSKTMSPALRVGFLVVPPGLTARFAEVAEGLAPAPNAIMQLAIAEFLRDGHYLRHLRRMKRLYASRRDALRACLGGAASADAMAGLAIVLRLPPGSDDIAIGRHARAHGLAPGVLSRWYASDEHRAPGLLLGVTNLGPGVLPRASDRLKALVRELSGGRTS